MTLELYACEECYEAGSECLSIKIHEAIEDAKAHGSRVIAVEFEYADQTTVEGHDYRARCEECGKLLETDNSDDPACRYEGKHDDGDEE